MGPAHFYVCANLFVLSAAPFFMCWMSTPLDTLCLQVTCAFLHGHTHAQRSLFSFRRPSLIYNKRNINNDLFFFLSFGALLFLFDFYLSTDERERDNGRGGNGDTQHTSGYNSHLIRRGR